MNKIKLIAGLCGLSSAAVTRSAVANMLQSYTMYYHIHNCPRGFIRKLGITLTAAELALIVGDKVFDDVYELGRIVIAKYEEAQNGRKEA